MRIVTVLVMLFAFTAPSYAANSIGGESAHVAHKSNDCTGKRWAKNTDDNGDHFLTKDECKQFVRDNRTAH